MQTTFKRAAHVAYFLRCLQALPGAAQGHDTNRIVIAYFCIAGLDLLGVLEIKTSEEQRWEWAEWVWSLQADEGGFRGSTAMDIPADDITSSSATAYNPPHLPSTYTALLVLALLRADMRRVDWVGLEVFLKQCRGADGSFAPYPRSHAQSPNDPSAERTIFANSIGDGFQADARMAYCASVVEDLIAVRKGAIGSTTKASSSLSAGVSSRDIGKGKEVAWLEACQSWEGGYAQRPQLEAQGGTTYCCLAALRMRRFSRQEKSSAHAGSAGLGEEHQDDAALRWLVSRQVVSQSGRKQENDDDDEQPSPGGGFQGRPGKDEDVCYSFWCGAAIRILAGEAMFDVDANTQALLNAQSPLGGFGKEAGDYPDPLHSYLALAALAMNQADIGLRKNTPGGSTTPIELKALDSCWNVSVETQQWLLSALRAL